MLTNGLCITVECIRVCFLTVKYISLLFEDFSLSVGKRTRNQSIQKFLLAKLSKISAFALYCCIERIMI